MRSTLFRFKILFLILMLAPPSLTQPNSHKPNPVPTLRLGAIGVVYLINETPTTLYLEISFPAQFVDNYSYEFANDGHYNEAKVPVQFAGSILIFDQAGQVRVIAKPGIFRLTRWCENDGGEQYRPELKIRLMKSSLRRPLHPVKAIQSIAAFAIAVPTDGKIPSGIDDVAVSAPGKDVRLQGKLDMAQQPAAMILVEPDQAGNCAGKPDNNLTIYLRTKRGDWPLRCCGP